MNWYEEPVCTEPWSFRKSNHKWRLIQNRSNNALLPDMWIFAYTTVSDWRVYKLLQHFVFITGGNVRNGFNIAI